MLSRASKKIQTLVIIGIVLIAMRFSIPPALQYYVSAILNDMPGYNATIGKIDVHFLKAGYTLDSVTLFTTNAEIPFIEVGRIDVKLQWESLLRGGVVTEITLHEPTISFTTTSSGAWNAGDDTDWTIPVKRLSFFPVNHLSVKDGTLSFGDFNSEPPVKVFLRNIDIESHNLVTITDEADALPSRIFAKAQSIGNGSLNIVMKLNTLKALPDLDLDLKLENVNMLSLKDFLSTYARIDVLQGNFNLDSEVTVINGKVDGYVKPKLYNVTLDAPQPVRVIMGKFQQPESSQTSGDALAAHIPLRATVHSMERNFWPVLWNIFRNASVEGFEQNTKGADHLASDDKTL